MERTGSKFRRQALLPFAVLAVAGVMIAAGTQSGELETVFRKATMICLECIGIG